MLFRRKKTLEYDHENEVPVIHSSICTGEKVIGFKNKKTHAFREVMLVKTPEDIEEFMNLYGITEKIKTEY